MDKKKPYSSVRGTPINPNTAKARTDYLISYNAVSAVLWSAVLSQVIGTIFLQGADKVYNNAAEFTRLVQSLAVMEVVHSAAGLVRAPIATTVMQVASRFFLVWGVAYLFPDTTSETPAYISMLVAWSVTEIIRYSYFALSLKDGRAPDSLTWLRYNTFFVLYPVGIASECWIVFKATKPASAWMWQVECVLWLALAFYPPGAYILFTHMMTQREKVMKGLAGKRSL